MLRNLLSIPEGTSLCSQERPDRNFQPFPQALLHGAMSATEDSDKAKGIMICAWAPYCSTVP